MKENVHSIWNPWHGCTEKAKAANTVTCTVWIKSIRTCLLKDKNLQKEMAFKSGISFQGKQPVYRFLDRMGLEIPESELYVPHFREHCQRCPNQAICNGCTDCGRCEK